MELSAEWKALCPNLDAVLASVGPNTAPPRPLIFCAFKQPVATIRIVIIGQDPYHDGSANGLSFSADNKIPPSLANIYKCLVN